MWLLARCRYRRWWCPSAWGKFALWYTNFWWPQSTFVHHSVDLLMFANVTTKFSNFWRKRVRKYNLNHKPFPQVADSKVNERNTKKEVLELVRDTFILKLLKYGNEMRDKLRMMGKECYLALFCRFSSLEIFLSFVRTIRKKNMTWDESVITRQSSSHQTCLGKEGRKETYVKSPSQKRRSGIYGDDEDQCKVKDNNCQVNDCREKEREREIKERV